MSTKTTLKRIALVAVSAMGFGVVPSVMSPVYAASTKSFTVDKTSITVVTPSGGAGYDSTTANGAIFKIVLRNEGLTATDQQLQVGETLTATVVGVPTGTTATAKTLAANAGDLYVTKVSPKVDANVDGNPYKVLTQASWSDSAVAYWNETDTAWSETNTSDLDNTFYMRVTPFQATVSGSETNAIDQGEYTIRLRLATSSLLIQDTLVKVKFVSSPIGAGAILTATGAGNWSTSQGALTSYSSTKYLSATLTDANGGRFLTETSAGTTAAPSLTVDVVDKNNLALGSATGLTGVDDGTESDTAITSSSTALAIDNATRNGVYGINTTDTNWLESATTDAAGGVNKLRVRYADKTAYYTLTMLSGLSSGDATASVSATGLSVLSSAPNWTVPLTTNSVTVSVSGATAGNDVLFTPAWTSTATADQSNLDDVAIVVTASSSGVASYTFTNAKPVNGATLTVSISGFETDPADQVITWKGSTASTMSVSLNGAIVGLKTSNTFVATVLDAFGAPVAGVVLTPSVSGANEADTYASLTTDAQGQASYTVTDTAAAADDTDAVTFTHVASTPITAVTSTITYAATTPSPSSISTFYARTGIAASADSVSEVSTPVPTTGIFETATTATPFTVTINRDSTRAITRSATGDHFTVRVRAAEGAAVTATAPTGAYILNSANFAVSSRTLYGDATGDVYFTMGSTKTGANSVTITSGTASATVSFWVQTLAANARFVTLTGPVTGTANGEQGSYKAVVTDRYGNPVSGVALTVAATGAAAFAGGSTLQSFTTGSDGTFTFGGTSYVADGGTGTFTASFTALGTDATSNAGYVGSTAVDSTLAKGVSSASLTVTYAAGMSAAAAAAEAASDAALEAIDAANAATDAANLAAEAADAATVAAEEARDAADAATAAVEALASDVATLIASLKAQITTLAKTVAKIAKKVKA